MQYLEYFEKETKDLEKRSKVESKIVTYKWGLTEEIHEVNFEYANEVANIRCVIKSNKNGGYTEVRYKEVWYSSYGQQSRKASNVKDAVENAKYMIDDWKAWNDNGAIPEVDYASDWCEWVSILDYPGEGEIIIVSDVRHTITVRHTDGTYETRTITVRGKDNLNEGFTLEVAACVEKLLD